MGPPAVRYILAGSAGGFAFSGGNVWESNPPGAETAPQRI